jgi:hypothetical protein
MRAIGEDMKPPVPQGESARHPLEGIPSFSPQTIQLLKQKWIETAEQVLALSGTTEGRDGLRNLLGLDEAGLNDLLAKLSDVVGNEAAPALRTATPGGALGAILTDEQKQKFGMK